ncbi:MAG: TIGR04282 family arsenosugar biosynthesis glycosyltransferase [Gemmatimonadetes bacterium]|nr:TIGR04282 family arsenosugar biosynthesis glycosyltransferase [Gemmatimonadota bacterium]
MKTRLTPVLRAAEAADLYRALLVDTVEVAESTGANVVVAFTPHGARGPLERLLGRHRRYLPQGPGDLGQRLAYAFERLCDGPRPTLVVGSDCPGLGPDRLREAAEALKSSDIVVGPAIDGGYYLLGLTRPRPEVFAGVPWSTGRVFEATMARIGEAGLRARVLAVERDLDTPEDLFDLYAGTRTATWAEAYPRTWKKIHALLPPRRLSMLEEVVAERRGDGPG